MQYPPPLFWDEGMLLTAQHMQALGRYVEGRNTELWLSGMPHAWGIAKLEIDPAALGNYRGAIVGTAGTVVGAALDGCHVGEGIVAALL